MKKSINQLKIELKEIAEAHLQVNSFYWGDIIDATHQTAIQYPLMNCYYPNGSFNFNTSVVQIVIEVGDKLYKDSSNLNDVESDTLQMIRDVYQIINKSVRWKTFGKVQNATYNKFKWSTADEIAGHRLTVNFALRDSSGVCDLPLVGYDYDGDGDVPAGGCPSVTVINSDMSFDVDVTAGDILQLADITYDIKNSEGTTIVSGSEVAQSNVAATAPDITITDSDGTPTVFPSGKNFVCIPAADATVENSDTTYTNTVASGGTLVLPDEVIQILDENDNLIQTINNPTLKDLNIELSSFCAEASYLVQYDNLTPIQSGTVASGGSVTVNVPDPVTAVSGVASQPLATGQDVSYATDDDGSVQRGRSVYTMPIVSAVQQLNHFGSKWAITGYTGGYYDYDTNEYKDVSGVVTIRDLAFPDYLIVDHRTKNYDGDLLMWSLSSGWAGVANLNETTARTTAAALTVAGFSSWVVPNYNEVRGTFYQSQIKGMPPIVADRTVNNPAVVLMSNTEKQQDPTVSILGLFLIYQSEYFFGRAATNANVRYAFVRVTNISEL